MERYGIGYMGSKNQIAEDIIKILPPAEYFVDLFGGGCAITHCAMLSGKFNKFILNDINDVPQLFKQAIQGDLKGYCTIPDREQFNKEKDDDIALKLINSFGNGGESFAFGEEIEDWKVYGQRMLSMPSMYERRMNYKKFIKAIKEYLLKDGEINNSNLQSLQSLERLQNLESLQSLERVKDLKVYKGDYMDVPIPKDSIVYCDIPYINTDCQMYDGFNWDRYYKWLSIIDHPVFTSEYTAPPDTFEVFSIEKVVLMSNDNKNVKEEKVFLQNRYKVWWEETKEKEPEQIDLFKELEELNG